MDTGWTQLQICYISQLFRPCNLCWCVGDSARFWWLKKPV